jgi:hypothetical protein
MVQNIGKGERILRVIVGIVLLSLAVFGPRSPWGLLGIVPLVTGGMGFCAVYQALGISGVHGRTRERRV